MVVQLQIRRICHNRKPVARALAWPLCAAALGALSSVATGSPTGDDNMAGMIAPVLLTNGRLGAAVSAEISGIHTAATRLTGQAANSPTISSILIIGNHSLSQTALSLLSGHKVGDPCTPAVLAEMRANLLQTGNFGLHSANPEDGVKVRTEIDHTGPDRLKVVIEVDENDVVAGVNIKGAGPIKPTEIQLLLHLKPGVVYNPIQFRRDYADIQQLYNRKGYAVAPAEDAGFDTRNQLNVALNVMKVTEIRVLHNHRTKSIVIQREMRTKRNSYYNERTLQDDRFRLSNLGIFEEVQVASREVGPGQALVEVDVKEKKAASVTGGFNYSAIDGLVGTASVIDNNFRGLGETLSLNGQLGTDLQHHSVELDYRRPWLDRQGTGLGLQVYDKNTYRFADNVTNGIGSSLAGQGGRYSQQRTGAALQLSRPLGGAYQGALTVRGENTVTNPLDLTGANAQLVQNGPLYSLGTALQHDTRDLIADPVKGSFQSVAFNVGHASLRSPLGSGAPEFGTHDFAKSQLDYRLFYSLSGARRPGHPEDDRSSLAFRLMAGGSAGHLPFSEQYFLGGGESLRGYREDRFWGSNLLLSSMELRQPIAPRFKLVAFMDVGEAWGGDYGGVNIGGFSQRDVQPHVGAGFGLRVATKMGAIRIDLGFGDEGARTHFGFGTSF